MIIGHCQRRIHHYRIPCHRRIHRRRINIYHNARLISDRVPQRALAVTLGTIVGGHDGAMLCHPGGSRRYHTIFAPHLVDYCIVVVNFVVSIILCHCHATTNRLPIQFCCIQPLVLPYRNYCNHVPSLLIRVSGVRPFLVDQNNCCIIRLRPVRLLDDVELYHVSVVGISLVLVISLVLDVDLMEYKPSLPMIVSSLSLLVTISLVLVERLLLYNAHCPRQDNLHPLSS